MEFSLVLDDNGLFIAYEYLIFSFVKEVTAVQIILDATLLRDINR
jgi:hypothetical protein